MTIPESSRMRLAILVALPIEIGLWLLVAHAFLRVPSPDLAPVEITRVVMDAEGRKVEKVVTKKEIEKNVAKVLKQAPPPSHPKPIPVTRATPAPKQSALPQGAHNNVITAKPTAVPAPNSSQDLSSGNAKVGTPPTSQNPGNAVSNPPVPTQPNPPPAVQNLKPAPPTPTSTDKPQPTPKPPPPPPPPPSPPAPKGPTDDAEPTHQVQPEIPDDLKSDSLKTYVRVRVQIAADGSFTVTLRTSSGNSEVDRRVLDALQKWKWKPALKDGEPIPSTALFKFEFEIQ